MSLALIIALTAPAAPALAHPLDEGDDPPSGLARARQHVIAARQRMEVARDRRRELLARPAAYRELAAADEARATELRLDGDEAGSRELLKRAERYRFLATLYERAPRRRLEWLRTRVAGQAYQVSRLAMDVVVAREAVTGPDDQAGLERAAAAGDALELALQRFAVVWEQLRVLVTPISQEVETELVI